MNMWCTARLKFDARQVAKNAIYTAFICNFRFWFTHTFLLQKLFMHFFVTKRICAHFFCREHGLRVFFAKMIYTLRPESFCALKVAIRKVQTFWASGQMTTARLRTDYWFSEKKHHLSKFFITWRSECAVALLAFNYISYLASSQTQCHRSGETEEKGIWYLTCSR